MKPLPLSRIAQWTGGRLHGADALIDAIVADILKGFSRPDAALVQRDRAAAIARAIGTAGASDIVLIAGKGHEPYQEIAGVRHPFDDTAVARALLQERRA